MSSQNLSLYITTEHECGYYDDRMTSNLIPDPQVQITASLYSLLISKGFRRSGDFVYRPHCKTCQACMPSRINVNDFKPSKNQRRCLKKNNDLSTHLVDAKFKEEYFSLYQRYLNNRHQEGSMANPSRDDFNNFLLNDWKTSIFIESRLQGELICVAVVDVLRTGPSAVYTFFSPEQSKRSLGTFAVLQQIWLSQLYHLPHVYLGYWIDGHPKMDYKRNFRGMELFQDDQWQAFPYK